MTLLLDGRQFAEGRASGIIPALLSETPAAFVEHGTGIHPGTLSRFDSIASAIRLSFRLLVGDEAAEQPKHTAADTRRLLRVPESAQTT